MKKGLIIMAIALVVVTMFTIVACSPQTQPAEEEVTSQGAAEEWTEEQSPEEQPVEHEVEGELTVEGELAENELTETDTPSEETTEGEIVAGETPITVQVTGEVTEILENTQLHVVGEEGVGTVTDVLANTDENTAIVDAQTGEQLTLADLKEGDKVIVYVSGAMTRSQPPVANAYAVITNIPETGLGVPTYVIAEEVTQNENGSVSILNENKDLVVTIPGDVKISVFGEDGKTAPASEIKKGTAVLAWFDVVAESYPAQATATSAMVINTVTS